MFDLIPFDRRRRRRGDLVERFFGKDLLTDFLANDFFGMDSIIRADIKENEQEYIVEAEIPGINRDNIEVELRDNNLIITANYNEEINEEKENFIKKERKIGKASRNFYIENVNPEQVTAEYKNGILKITLPKLKRTSPKGRIIDID